MIDHFRTIGRKRFIITGGLVGSLSLFPLPLLHPVHQMIPVTMLFFTSHMGIVFLDVTADAWAIETTKYHDREWEREPLC